MTDPEQRDIVERLKEKCVGHPHAKIPWPHHELHDAIAEITRLRRKLEIPNDASDIVEVLLEPTRISPGISYDPPYLQKRAADEITRLRAEVASLRLTLGGKTFDATIPEPIGCPCPGACSTVAEIARLRAELAAAHGMTDAFRDALHRQRNAALEEAAEECEKQKERFLSPQYATHQPLSSASERFACGTCAASVRALKDAKP